MSLVIRSRSWAARGARWQILLEGVSSLFFVAAYMKFVRLNDLPSARRCLFHILSARSQACMIVTTVLVQRYSCCLDFSDWPKDSSCKEYHKPVRSVQALLFLRETLEHSRQGTGEQEPYMCCLYTPSSRRNFDTSKHSNFQQM